MRIKRLFNIILVKIKIIFRNNYASHKYGYIPFEAGVYSEDNLRYLKKRKIIKMINKLYIKILIVFFILTLIFSFFSILSILTLKFKKNNVIIIKQYELLTKNNISKVLASSIYPKMISKTYEPDNISDGILETAWIENNPDYGIGEFVEVFFEVPGLLNKLSIFNGYNEITDSGINRYRDNSRTKTFQIELYNQGGIVQTITWRLIDSRERQELNFIEPVVVDKIKFIIKEVYTGTLFKDTAISEILIN